MEYAAISEHAETRVAILGSRDIGRRLSRQTCVALGKALASDPNLHLVTGGCPGVQEVVSRNFFENGGSHVLHLATPGIRPLGFGEHRFVGNSFAENRLAVAMAADIYVAIEGGPGTVDIIEKARKRGAHVVCLPASGGAAAGKFWMPKAVYQAPENVPTPLWDVLRSSNAEAAGHAAAEIVKLLAVLPKTRASKL